MSVGKIPHLSEMGSLPVAATAQGAAHAHDVHFYQGDAELIEELARLVGPALANGDAALVVATQPHREALFHRLAAHDLNVSRIATQGRYVALDAREILDRFMVGGKPDAELFGAVVGGIVAGTRSKALTTSGSILIFGEMVSLLWAAGDHDAALRLEELWNNLAAEHTFTLRCAYPLSAFDHATHSDKFGQILNVHSAVVPAGGSHLLLGDDERLRSISKLQQRLEVLEQESALRASELRFQLLVEAVQDYAIFILDPEGRVSTWNSGAQRIKGYRASEIIGHHFSRFYPPDDVASQKPQRELEIAARDGRLEDEGWRLRKDGSRFWANVIITALRDPQGTLVGFAKVTRDFTERQMAQQELEESRQRLQASEKSLRKLSLHLLRTQDEERRRIGRDLHDSLGQYLTVLKMKIDGLNREVSDGRPIDFNELAQCAQIAGDSVKEVRTIAYLLYPPMLEEMGLRSAIPWYLEGFTKRCGVQTTFHVPSDFPRLAAEVELALFRVLQEALTNVHRHSGSESASVRLAIRGREAMLQIADQGKGAEFLNLEEASRDWMGALGVGLRGMSERVRQIGGKLEVSSSPQGTTVTAIVPIPDSAPAEGNSQGVQHAGQNSDRR